MILKPLTAAGTIVQTEPGMFTLNDFLMESAAMTSRLSESRCSGDHVTWGRCVFATFPFADKGRNAGPTGPQVGNWNEYRSTITHIDGA